jgi:hypothetical protein
LERFMDLDTNCLSDILDFEMDSNEIKSYFDQTDSSSFN